MSRIVAVTNLKGGIGKTTTVVNVGAGFALKGLRVLLVDVDAQGNLAVSLGVTPRRTLYEVLVDNVPATDCIITARPNLDLLASDESLLSAQQAIANRPDWSRVIEQKIAPLKPAYDLILLDAPGSLTLLSINAIVAARELVVPTTVEPLSIKGLALLFKQVTRVKNGTQSIRIIVPTMFDARMRQSATLLAQLQELYGALVTPPIRANVRLSESTSTGKTIYEYDPRSRGSLDYAHLVERLSDMWNLQPAPVEKPPSAAPEPAPAPPTPPRTNGTPAPAPVAPPAPPADTAVVTPVASERAVDRPASDNASHAQPVVTGTHGVAHPCPLCGHPLRRTTIAGYRVAYCDHCKYIEQELATGVRR
jgi:chromosome partitioning protein